MPGRPQSGEQPRIRPTVADRWPANRLRAWAATTCAPGPDRGRPRDTTSRRPSRRSDRPASVRARSDGRSASSPARRIDQMTSTGQRPRSESGAASRAQRRRRRAAPGCRPRSGRGAVPRRRSTIGPRYGFMQRGPSGRLDPLGGVLVDDQEPAPGFAPRREGRPRAARRSRGSRRARRGTAHASVARAAAARRKRASRWRRASAAAARLGRLSGARRARRVAARARPAPRVGARGVGLHGRNPSRAATAEPPRRAPRRARPRTRSPTAGASRAARRPWPATGSAPGATSSGARGRSTRTTCRRSSAPRRRPRLPPRRRAARPSRRSGRATRGPARRRRGAEIGAVRVGSAAGARPGRVEDDDRGRIAGAVDGAGDGSTRRMRGLGPPSPRRRGSTGRLRHPHRRGYRRRRRAILSAHAHPQEPPWRLGAGPRPGLVRSRASSSAPSRPG